MTSATLADHSAVVVRFTMTLAQARHLPYRCRTIITPQDQPHVLLATYHVAIRDERVLSTSLTSPSGHQTVKPMNLTYLRCFGASCENKLIEQSGDFHYFTEMHALEFQLNVSIPEWFDNAESDVDFSVLRGDIVLTCKRKIIRVRCLPD